MTRSTALPPRRGLSATIPLLRSVLGVLPAGSRRVVIRYSILTSALAILDIVSLGAFALVLPAMVAGGSANLPLLGSISGAGEFAVILTAIASVIVLKSMLSIVVVRAGTMRFAKQEVALGDSLLKSYLRIPWVERLSLNSSDIVRSVDTGVSSTISGVLIPASFLAGEAVSTLAVLAVLIVAEPLTAAVTIAYLGLVAFILTQQISRRAVKNGLANRDQSARAHRLVTEAIAMLKEIVLRGAEASVLSQVRATRDSASRSRAKISLFSIIPRYILEAALILGFLLVGATGWITGGQNAAVTSVALFAVAGFRIIPSLTRLQAIMSQIHSNAPFANLVIEQIGRVRARGVWDVDEDTHDTTEATALGSDIVLDHVSFTYPGAIQPALDDVSLVVPTGSRVAFVGASGAGKSSTVDVVLGLLAPDRGTFTVGGQPVNSVLRAWQASIGYVPQEVTLFDASIAQNVALTWEPRMIDRDRVHQALADAQLGEFIAARPEGIDGVVGERGIALSGGQRQRLGIARALYGRPTVLILDEATSALDTSTEASVIRAIRELGPEMTVITVAHRLATIRDADVVFYFEQGRVVAQGDFDAVVKAAPGFARHAALAGLSGEDGP